MTATLKRFRVQQFRSVVDSGWIDTDEITALIGTNESGKTNLLVALWKLKPAKSGKIDLIADLPRKQYHQLRGAAKKPVFITAEFELDPTVKRAISDVTSIGPDELGPVRVSRSFDNGVIVSFPGHVAKRTAPAEDLRAILDRAKEAVTDATELKGESGLKAQILATVSEQRKGIQDGDVTIGNIREIRNVLAGASPSGPMATSSIVPPLRQCVEEFTELAEALDKQPPGQSEEARKLAWESIPPIIYYSTYGNLDAEIYLPHVIANLKRNDLGEKEEAKARTLKVLFEFVKLSPEEILTLGQEAGGEQPDDLAAAATRKKEREILLQSASTDLTGRFRDWWKQGDYQFRFQADGNHFRIWVSDDRRPEAIELEGRSSGMQWFFSFYLVFLVEAEDSHEDAILLLDEPGLSLHPVSQKDLSDFFKGLAAKNQIVYTTHSPFMVDADRLDRVKAVFVQNDGTTGVSADLRTAGSDKNRENSIYPVHAALGLSVSDTLLQGCQAVIVEGPSDQHYLTAVKNLLLREGRLKPPRELVFLPAGGVKGVKAIAGILSAKEDSLPWVLLDSDTAGVQFAKHLRDGLYVGHKDRVLLVGDHFGEVPQAEIEDLFPPNIWDDEVTRFLRGPDIEFDEAVDHSRAVCDQVSSYAQDHGLVLDNPGWKVEVAARVKRRILRKPEDFDLTSPRGRAWIEIFERFVST